MKYYLLLILIIFLNVFNSYTLNTNELLNFKDELKEATNLEKDEILLAIFQDIGSCIKCYEAPLNYLNIILTKNKKIKIKVLAFVLCKRKKELNLFIQRYNWKDFTMVDKGDVKQKLGLPQNSQITVFNDNYEIIINITDENLHIADSLVYEKIKG